MKYAVIFQGDEGERAAGNAPGNSEPDHNLQVVIANAVNEALEGLLEGEVVLHTRRIEKKDEDGKVVGREEETSETPYEMVGVQVRLIS